jgi:hypothetical protein
MNSGACRNFQRFAQDIFVNRFSKRIADVLAEIGNPGIAALCMAHLFTKDVQIDLAP